MHIHWTDAQRSGECTRKVKWFVRTNGWSKLEEIPMKFRPLHDRVVVKRIDAENKSAGGIIIPDTAKEKP